MSNSKISALTSATTPLAGTEVLPVVQSSTTKQVSVANLTAGRTVSAANYAMTSTSFAATIGTVTYFGQTASTAHIVGNVGSMGFGVNDGGNPAGVFVTNTFNGTYSSQEVELRTAQGGVSISTTRLRATKAGDVEFNTGNLVQGTAAKGVNFTANTPAAGMTSQLLNWYEEGTWTPTVSFATLSVSLTYSSRAGSYTKIGNRVTFSLYVSVANKGVSVGQFQISGLPFTSKSGVEDFTFATMVGGTNGVALPAGTTQFCAFLPGNSTTIVMYASGSSIGVQSITNTQCGTAFDMRINGSYLV